jgi:hypothetical protein
MVPMAATSELGGLAIEQTCPGLPFADVDPHALIWARLNTQKFICGLADSVPKISVPANPDCSCRDSEPQTNESPPVIEYPGTVNELLQIGFDCELTEDWPKVDGIAPISPASTVTVSIADKRILGKTIHLKLYL